MQTKQHNYMYMYKSHLQSTSSENFPPTPPLLGSIKNKQKTPDLDISF